jgi:hypothetical protein
MMIQCQFWLFYSYNRGDKYTESEKMFIADVDKSGRKDIIAQ